MATACIVLSKFLLKKIFFFIDNVYMLYNDSRLFPSISKCYTFWLWGNPFLRSFKKSSHYYYSSLWFIRKMSLKELLKDRWIWFGKYTLNRLQKLLNVYILLKTNF